MVWTGCPSTGRCAVTVKLEVFETDGCEGRIFGSKKQFLYLILDAILYILNRILGG